MEYGYNYNRGDRYISGGYIYQYNWGFEYYDKYKIATSFLKNRTQFYSLPQDDSVKSDLISGKDIYGTAFVKDCPEYMLQRVGNFLYQGVIISPFPCDEILEIYLDDKPFDTTDFSGTELAVYELELIGQYLNCEIMGESYEGDCQEGGTITLSLNGIDYTYAPTHGKYGLDALYNLYYQLIYAAPPNLRISIKSVAPVWPNTEFNYFLVIERITGSNENWDIDITINADTANTGISANLVRVKGGVGVNSFRIISELGDQVAANETLVSELDIDGAPQRWTENHKLLGCCHINIRWNYNWLMANIKRIPRVSVVVRAKTDNPAEGLLHFIQQKHGLNVPLELINSDAFTSAALACAEQVPSKTGTEQRYAFNYALDTGLNAAESIALFCDQMQAPLLFKDGLLSIVPAIPKNPVATLTLQDLASDINYTPAESLKNNAEAIGGSFTHSGQAWTLVEYPTQGTATEITTLDFPAETNPYRAQRLALLHLNLNYKAAVWSFSIKRLPIYLHADDLITLDFAPLGFSPTLVYIESISYDDKGIATLQCSSRDVSVFNYNPALFKDVPNINLIPLFVLREDLQ